MKLDEIKDEIKHVGLTTGQLFSTLRKPFKGTSVDIMRRSVKDIFAMNNTFLFIVAGWLLVVNIIRKGFPDPSVLRHPPLDPAC